MSVVAAFGSHLARNSEFFFGVRERIDMSRLCKDLGGSTLSTSVRLNENKWGKEWKRWNATARSVSWSKDRVSSP